MACLLRLDGGTHICARDLERSVQVVRSAHVLFCVLAAITSTVDAGGLESALPRQTSSATEPAIRIVIFLNSGCAGCELVEKESIEKLAKQIGISVEAIYYDIIKPLNYKKLVWAEKELGDTANELPVAIIGRKILGGEKELASGFRDALGDYAWLPVDDRFEIAIPAEMPQDPDAMPGSGRPIHLGYFYRPGCAGCQRAEHMLRHVKQRYPQVLVARYPQDTAQSILRLEATAARLGVAEDERLITPVGFIGTRRFRFEETPDAELERLVKGYGESGAEPWWEELDLSAAKKRLRAKWQGLTLGAVALGGLLDGINPCAFATLVLFVSVVTISARRRQHLLSLSLSFIGGVFCAYFLIGLGLTEAVGFLSGAPMVKKIIDYGIAGLCVVLAGLSLYDWAKARRGEYGKIALQLPASVKARIRSTVARFGRARYLAPAGFLTGLMISGLELVCTGQIYLPIIQLMSITSPTRAANLGWLTVYNLSFIAPLAAVFAFVYCGATSDALTALLRKHLALTKAATAAFFIGIAALLLAVV